MKNPLILIIAGLLIFHPLKLAFSAENLSPEQQDFVTQYVQAKNSKDLAKLQSLTLPQSIACENESTKEFFDELYRQEFKDQTPDDREVMFRELSAEEVNSEVATVTQWGSSYPKNPTHTLEISFNTDAGVVTIPRMLVQENGKFYVDRVCPSPEAVERFRQFKAGSK